MRAIVNTIIPGLIRLLLGGVFVYAGGSKLKGIEDFSDAIFGFQILPAGLVMPAALFFPIFEIVLGVMVLVPSKASLRIGSLGLIMVNALFIGVLTSAWIRGLHVDCGCFGSTLVTTREWIIPLAILRDLILLTGVVLLWWPLARRRLADSRVSTVENA